MNKYTALIVEDVKNTSDYILSRIKALCPMIGTLEQALTLVDAEEKIKQNNYDIVFLDIQMPTGTSFDLLKQLSEEDAINFEIIFITGESAKEYTLRAIKFSAIDFLYKPLDDTELVLSVNRAVERLNKQSYNHQIKLLLNRIDQQAAVKHNKVAFHLHSGIVQMVNINELMYMEADGVVSKAYLSTGEKITINRNLGFYKEILMIEHNFIPLSNKILANKDFIKRYNNRNLEVTLTDNTVLFASKRCGKELKYYLSENKKSYNLKKLLNLFKR